MLTLLALLPLDFPQACYPYNYYTQRQQLGPAFPPCSGPPGVVAHEGCSSPFCRAGPFLAQRRPLPIQKAIGKRAERHLFCWFFPRNNSLLVVHCSAGEFLALRIGSARGNRAALAVGRHDNATASGDLAAFLNVERQRMVVNFRVRPRV